MGVRWSRIEGDPRICGIEILAWRVIMADVRYSIYDNSLSQTFLHQRALVRALVWALVRALVWVVSFNSLSRAVSRRDHLVPRSRSAHL